MSRFLDERAKHRAAPADKADSARSQTAGPIATHGNAKKVGVPEVAKARDIASAEASNQHNYGTHREQIRKILPGWGQERR